MEEENKDGIGKNERNERNEGNGQNESGEDGEDKEGNEDKNPNMDKKGMVWGQEQYSINVQQKKPQLKDSRRRSLDHERGPRLGLENERGSVLSSASSSHQVSVASRSRRDEETGSSFRSTQLPRDERLCSFGSSLVPSLLAAASDWKANSSQQTRHATNTQQIEHANNSSQQTGHAPVADDGGSGSSPGRSRVIPERASGKGATDVGKQTKWSDEEGSTGGSAHFLEQMARGNEERECVGPCTGSMYGYMDGNEGTSEGMMYGDGNEGVEIGQALEDMDLDSLLSRQMAQKMDPGRFQRVRQVGETKEQQGRQSRQQQQKAFRAESVKSYEQQHQYYQAASTAALQQQHQHQHQQQQQQQRQHEASASIEQQHLGGSRVGPQKSEEMEYSHSAAAAGFADEWHQMHSGSQPRSVMASPSVGKMRMGGNNNRDSGLLKFAIVNQHKGKEDIFNLERVESEDPLSAYSMSRGQDLAMFLQGPGEGGEEGRGSGDQYLEEMFQGRKGRHSVVLDRGGGRGGKGSGKGGLNSSMRMGSMDLSSIAGSNSAGAGAGGGGLGLAGGGAGGGGGGGLLGMEYKSGNGEMSFEKQKARALMLGKCRRRGLNLHDYILGEPYDNVRSYFALHKKELGSGQFGVVRKCKEIATGRVYACKTIKKSTIRSEDEADDIRKEVACMTLVQQHPGFVNLKRVFEDGENVHLVMDLCKGGDLLDHITKVAPLSEENAARLCSTMVEALLHCHCLGIIHRDVKPENILLSHSRPDASMKLVDFGVSTFFKPDKALKDVIGTPEYMAPEVLKRGYGPQADIWSAGVVLYVALTTIPPFWAPNRQSIKECILSKEVSFTSTKWANISSQCKDLIWLMLQKDPKKRITAAEILNHPWVREYND